MIAGHVGDAGQNDWRPAQSGEKKSVQRLVRMSRWMIAGVNESQGRKGQWGRNLNTLMMTNMSSVRQEVKETTLGKGL